MMVLYTTPDGRMGYASYGETAALCRSAKALADAAYEAVEEVMSK